jgi:hypothetical protein
MTQDELNIAISKIKMLPIKTESCYCGSSNCYQQRLLVDLKEVLKILNSQEHE